MPLFYKTTHRLRSCYRFFILTLFLGLATLPTLAQTTWTGTTNADWNTPGNWSAGVPTTTLDAIIPNKNPSPTIGTNTSAVAKSVEVQSGGTLTIASSATLAINGSKTVPGEGTTAFFNDGTIQNSGQLLIGNTGSITGKGIYNRALFNNNATISIGSLATLSNDALQNDGTFNNNTGATIQIDRVNGDALSNESIFTNNGAIIIGANSEVNGAGIDNDGNFTNNAGGSIQIDRTTHRGLENYTTFTNSSTITIGASGSIGSLGLFNNATFNNNAGGFIQIDRTAFGGLENNSGTFTNVGRILIGSLATLGGDGLNNDVTFNNNAGGSIQIDRTSEHGINNHGTFINEASITIGALAGVGDYGVYNQATFNNNTGGSIQIDRSSFIGLYNFTGTFTNAATITIGASSTVGDFGVSNAGAFNNNTGGSIQIDRSSFAGLYHLEGTFNNAATITIGASTTVGPYGIYNFATFNNNTGGTIQIDRSTQRGLFNGLGTFTNAAIIKVDASVGNGIFNTATFHNNGCGGVIISQSSITSYNSYTFTNSGSIIEKASGNSIISNNTGLVQNLNGGDFTITNNSGKLITTAETFWTGCTSTNWATATNWSTGVVPTTADDVVIPGGTPNQPTIGASTPAVANSVEVQSGGTLTIASSATLAINGSKTVPGEGTIAFFNNGTIQNSGQVLIGNTGNIAGSGIYNRAVVNNNAGGTIQIDRTSGDGIENKEGAFTNSGLIRIGSLATVTGNGLYNDATFNNSTGGIIQIDRTGDRGIFNDGGTYINNATITIGASVVSSGIRNEAPATFHNNGCGAVITTQKMISGFNVFTNSGTIIEMSNNDSNISSNAGLVRNLNGGAFTITTNTGVLTTTEGTTAPTISAIPSLTVNSGQSVTLIADGATSYHWSTGETTPTISVTAAGPYSVTGTIGSCSRVASVTLTVNVVTDVTVTNPAAVCVPATVDLTQGVAVSSIPNATFYFYTDADGTQEVPNPAAVGGGTYYVKATSQEGGASALKSITVVVNTPPTVSISPNNPTICSGQSTTLTASGANTYLWSTGATSSTISVSSAGVVSATGITTGCSATATQTVTENAIPAPTLTTNVSASSPGSATVIQNTPFVTLTASGCSGTLAWAGPNNPSGSTISVPTSATGTLSYTVFCQQGGCSSSIASFTIVVTSGTTGSFDGFVNGADCGTFRGWAWDRNKPNTVVSVEILDGSTIIGTVPAGDFRQDLLDAGKGNGRHAFRFTIPENIKDGLPHNLSARVTGSSFILKDSPKALICAGTGTPTNKPPVPPTPTVLIAPLNAQIGVPFSGTLVSFTDPEDEPLIYGLSGLPNGLSINTTSRVISGTATVAGDFVLAYTATDPQLATNSVSFVLTVSAPQTTTVAGSFEGYLDKVECGTIRGWVWDRNKPNTPVTVEFYTGSTVWGSVVANIYRVDLKNAGKGNGVHAYSFDVPAALKDGTSRLIYGRVQGSTFVLKDSGKPLTCNVPVRLSAETASDLQVTVLGNPVLATALSVEIRGAEGQPLRLQLTDLQGRMLNERLLEKAEAREQQRFELGHRAAGFLFLQVSTPTQKRTIKILTN